MLDRILPIILTYNESANLTRTLAALKWAGNVLIVDSFSRDGTLQIAQSFSNVTVVQHAFESAARQWSFAQEQAEAEWLLTLDADYVVTPELVEELRMLAPAAETAGYSTAFIYCVHGRPLRSSILPPRISLFRRERGEFYDDGHTQRVRVRGAVLPLKGRILHDDRKPLERWLDTQRRYSRLEAERLRRVPFGEARLKDKIRKTMVLAPLLVGLYTLLGKGLILNGMHGCYYVMQRVYAELLLSLHLLDLTLAERSRAEG